MGKIPIGVGAIVLSLCGHIYERYLSRIATIEYQSEVLVVYDEKVRWIFDIAQWNEKKGAGVLSLRSMRSRAPSSLRFTASAFNSNAIDMRLISAHPDNDQSAEWTAYRGVKGLTLGYVAVSEGDVLTIEVTADKLKDDWESKLTLTGLHDADIRSVQYIVQLPLWTLDIAIGLCLLRAIRRSRTQHAP